jgi:20S proteasome alpha/beta subunit
MTITVSIKCTDGIAICTDSRLTVNGFAQQQGQKIHLLQGPQVFAFAGDLGLAERFRAIAEELGAGIQGHQHKLLYALDVAQSVIQNFQATGIDPGKADLAALLAFIYNGKPEICSFGMGTQPHFLDDHHFIVASGSGSVASVPFAKFLIDNLLCGAQPSIAEGRLLAVWAVHYSIETMSGSVGGPIDLATIEQTQLGEWEFKEHDQDSVQETLEAVQSACDSLRQWSTELVNSSTAEPVPKP